MFSSPGGSQEPIRKGNHSRRFKDAAVPLTSMQPASLCNFPASPGGAANAAAQRHEQQKRQQQQHPTLLRNLSDVSETLHYSPCHPAFEQLGVAWQHRDGLHGSDATMLNNPLIMCQSHVLHDTADRQSPLSATQASPLPGHTMRGHAMPLLDSDDHVNNMVHYGSQLEATTAAEHPQHAGCHMCCLVDGDTSLCSTFGMAHPWALLAELPYCHTSPCPCQKSQRRLLRPTLFDLSLHALVGVKGREPAPAGGNCTENHADMPKVNAASIQLKASNHGKGDDCSADSENQLSRSLMMLKSIPSHCSTTMASLPIEQQQQPCQPIPPGCTDSSVDGTDVKTPNHRSSNAAAEVAGSSSNPRKRLASMLGSETAASEASSTCGCRTPSSMEMDHDLEGSREEATTQEAGSSSGMPMEDVGQQPPACSKEANPCKKTMLRIRPTLADVISLNLFHGGDYTWTVGNIPNAAVSVSKNGTITYQGQTFSSISSFALVVLRSRNPNRQACDGWKEVRHQGVKMEVLRQRALKYMTKQRQL